MERNCHLIDLHKVIMAVILTAIKNQKNLHTLLDKPEGKLSFPLLLFERKILQIILKDSVMNLYLFTLENLLSY